MFDHLIVSLKRDSSLIRIVSHCLSCRKQMMENFRFCTFFSTCFLSVTPEISESRASERLPCVSNSRWWWSVWLLSLSVLVGSGFQNLCVCCQTSASVCSRRGSVDHQTPGLRLVQPGTTSRSLQGLGQAEKTATNAVTALDVTPTWTERLFCCILNHHHIFEANCFNSLFFFFFISVHNEIIKNHNKTTSEH